MNARRIAILTLCFMILAAIPAGAFVLGASAGIVVALALIFVLLPFGLSAYILIERKIVAQQELEARTESLRERLYRCKEWIIPAENALLRIDETLLRRAFKPGIDSGKLVVEARRVIPAFQKRLGAIGELVAVGGHEELGIAEEPFDTPISFSASTMDTLVGSETPAEIHPVEWEETLKSLALRLQSVEFLDELEWANE